MTDLQYLPKASVNSNSNFFYKDNTTINDRIDLKHNPEYSFQIRHHIMNHLRPHLAVKENPHSCLEVNTNNIRTSKNIYNSNDTYNAFDKAITESYKTDKILKEKHKILEDKRTQISTMVNDRNKLSKERMEVEKQNLKEVLTRIIKDTLKFSKECTPMISMMPTKLTQTIGQIKQDRRGVLNISSGSLNLSLRSNTSNTSAKKYESNAFLKALGLDLNNLNPNNINIDIDKAFDFIQNWKVKNDDIAQVIRFKVVNEIMNVEERRSVQKIKKINSKINFYLERKKQSKINNAIKKDDSASISSIDKGSFLDTQRKFNNSKFERKTKSSSKTKGSRRGSRLTSPNVKATSPSIGKNRFRKNEMYQKKDKNKNKKVKLNAYKHVDKVLGYINNSENLRDNEKLVEHFSNIKYNKYCDIMTKKLMKKNEIKTIV